MRLLLLSDTHGHLDSIDGLARSVCADAIIHAGDFGFYDDASVDRLESRELFLRIIHSDLPADIKAQAKKRKGAALREFNPNPAAPRPVRSADALRAVRI